MNKLFTNKNVRMIVSMLLAVVMCLGLITTMHAASPYQEVYDYYNEHWGCPCTFEEFQKLFDLEVKTVSDPEGETPPPDMTAQQEEKLRALGAWRTVDYYQAAWEIDLARLKDSDDFTKPSMAQAAWANWQRTENADQTFSVELRKAIRAQVYEAQVDPEYLPSDHSFWLATTQELQPTDWNGQMDIQHERAFRTWAMDRHGIEVTPSGMNFTLDNGLSMWLPFDPELADEYEARYYAEHGIEPPERLASTISESTPAPTATPIPEATPSPVETAPAEKKGSVFPDVVPGSWYEEAVNAMVASGLLHGKDDGLFHPEDPITIGEWCYLLYCITFSDNQGIPTRYVGCNIHFTHWSAYAIDECYDKGLTQMRPVFTSEGLRKNCYSYPEGTPPEITPARRGEALYAVVEILDRAGMLSERLESQTKKYTLEDIPDGSLVGEGPEQWYWQNPNKPVSVWTHFWDAEHILNAYNAGITTGVDAEGTCDPMGTLTRAQACKLLYDAGLDHCVGIFSQPSWGIIGSF